MAATITKNLCFGLFCRGLKDHSKKMNKYGKVAEKNQAEVLAEITEIILACNVSSGTITFPKDKKSKSKLFNGN